MKPLDAIFTEANAQVVLNVLAVDENVLVYTGALKEFATAGDRTIEHWLPDELESVAGGKSKLGTAKGYNLMILPIVSVGKPGKMTIRVRVAGKTKSHDKTYQTDVPNDAPFGWRIHVK